MDLEQLCQRPRELQAFILELATRLEKYDIDGICGALNEGAFLALMVASQMDVAFSYSERFDDGSRDKLFPVTYRIPGVLRDKIRGKRIAIVNDVISAGSAVRGTYNDAKACGADPVVVGALLVLGDAFSEFAAANGFPVESLAFAPNNMWDPAHCPLCASNVPLEIPFANSRRDNRRHPAGDRV
jgi:orotate phosphoribosyltransferase